MQLTVEMQDGTVHKELRVLNPSLVAYDRSRSKRDWPHPKEGPVFWLTFLAWHTLKAQQKYDGTFEQFSSTDCIDIDDGEDEDDEPDPTRRAATEDEFSI